MLNPRGIRLGSLMDIAVAIVAVAFGGLMGWGLGRIIEDLRPVLAALLFGIATGAVVWIASLGDDPSLIGGSLVLGCTAGLAAISPRLRRPA
jgi:hypothetical protein